MPDTDQMTAVAPLAALDAAADRRVGSLITQALGDALGFLVEGWPPEVCREYADWAFLEERPPRFRARIFGQYSDDTQLARELARSLIAANGWCPEDYAKRVAQLFASDRIVGRGRATEAAALRILAGVSWDHAGEPSPSAGNGAAMRVAPIGFRFTDEAERRRVADEQARITHLDHRSRAAAVLVADVVADAVGEPAAAALPGTPAWCDRMALPLEALDPALAEGVRALPRWLAAPLEEAAAEIARAGDCPKGSAHEFERWHGISPFATPSALYAVYAYARTPLDAEQVLHRAVSVGGDVDTVAAMAGAMVGARVGWSGLSQRLRRWALHLNDRGEDGLEVLAELGR